MQEITSYLTQNGFERFSPKAVLFDMDGVLYDSMPYHAIAWEQSMKQFGIRMSKEDAYLTEGQKGIDTIKQMMREQQNRIIDDEQAMAMYEEKARIFHQLAQQPRIFDGVHRLMQCITDSGMKCIVVTGSAQRLLIDRLTKDFAPYITPDHIVTAFDVAHGKPAPDPYLAGLKRAGNLLPCEAIVVENAPLGVKAGVAARIFTIAVNSGPLPDTALQDAGANVVYQKISEIADNWNLFTTNS